METIARARSALVSTIAVTVTARALSLSARNGASSLLLLVGHTITAAAAETKRSRHGAAVVVRGEVGVMSRINANNVLEDVALAAAAAGGSDGIEGVGISSGLSAQRGDRGTTTAGGGRSVRASRSVVGALSTQGVVVVVVATDSGVGHGGGVEARHV